MKGKFEVVNIKGVDTIIEFDMVLYELEETASYFAEYLEEIIAPIRKKFLSAGLTLGKNYHEKSFERDLDRCEEIYHEYYRQMSKMIHTNTTIIAPEDKWLEVKALTVDAEKKKMDSMRQYIKYDKSIHFDIEQIKLKLRGYRKYLYMINKIKFDTWTYADTIDFLTNYHNGDLYYLSREEKANKLSI